MLPTKPDFEKDFAPHDLLAKVIAGLEAYGMTTGETEALQLKEGFAKKLVEEVYPLALLVTRLYPEKTTKVVVRPNLDSKNFDGTIKQGSTQQLVEITSAIDGHAQFKAMKHLHLHGYSPVASNVKTTGIGKNMQIRRARIMTMTPSSDPNAALKLIHKAMEKKTKKHYPKSHWIVVAFTDANMTSENTHNILKHSFLELADNLFPGQARIFLLGALGHIFVDSAAEI